MKSQERHIVLAFNCLLHIPPEKSKILDIYSILTLQMAILITVLLQVKTFVLYPCHYDRRSAPEEVQMFFKELATRS